MMNSAFRAICLAGAITGYAIPFTAAADPEPNGAVYPTALDVPPVGEFGLGLGYGTDTGFALSAHATALGLGDEGHQFGFRFVLGEDSGSADLVYRYAPLDGRDDLTFGLNLSGVTTRPSDAFGFSTDAVELTPRLIYQLSANTVLSPYLAISSGQVSDVRIDSSALISRDEGRQRMTSAGLEFQRVRNGNEGTRQTMLIAGIEVGRSDRGQTFTGLSFDLRHDRRVGSDGRYEVSTVLLAGTIVSHSGASNVGDRTFLGSSTLRGFDFGGFGPRDLAAAGQPALGGNSYASMRLEVRNSGILGEEARLVPGLFLDAGSLWGLDDTAGGPARADLVDDGAHMRASVGLMLDYRSDFGTFQLSVAKPVSQLNYDRTSPIQFGFTKGF